MKKYPLLKEIGFRDKASKSIEDVAADKFEDFGVYIGQLYQKFQNKDISNNPAITQKIMNLVDADDDNVLMNKIKDLEFLINQLPNKQQPTDNKIGFKVNEDQTTDNLIDDLIDRADKVFSGNELQKIRRGLLFTAIQSNPETQNKNLIYYTKLISNAEKRKFGKDDDEMPFERKLTAKEKRDKEKIVKGLKGRKDLDKSDKYAIATAQAKKMEEMTDDEFEKAKEADRLEKHPERDKIKKIQQMMAKEKNEEKISGFDYHYTKGTSGGTQQFGRPRIVNE